MQDCYVGDVGDFGKYGLLRALCPAKEDSAGPRLSLGVVWYHVPNEEYKNDGMETKYLNCTKDNLVYFESCDPPLYDKLKIIVVNNRRKVESIREDGVLTSCEVFYEDILTFDGMPNFSPTARDMRLKRRRKWIEGAYKKMHGVDVVFFDPDNGLEVTSTARHNKKGPKYIFFDELVPYWLNGKSLIIYQHLNMRITAEKQIAERRSQILKHLKCRSGMFTLLYHREVSRFFLVIPAERHRDTLLKRADCFVRGIWGQHFDLI